MKKLLIAFALFLVTTSSFAQKSNKTAKGKIKPKMDKYNDNIDNRMKGPAGEVIYIGTQGGRYYKKNGKKVYVDYKGNDNK